MTAGYRKHKIDICHEGVCETLDNAGIFYKSKRRCNIISIREVDWKLMNQAIYKIHCHLCIRGIPANITRVSDSEIEIYLDVIDWDKLDSISIKKLPEGVAKWV